MSLNKELTIKTTFYFLALLTSFSAPASEIKRIDYEGFTVWVDCDKRGAVKFQYNTQNDTGSFKRHKSFHIDSDASASCQPYPTSWHSHTALPLLT